MCGPRFSPGRGFGQKSRRRSRDLAGTLPATTARARGGWSRKSAPEAAQCPPGTTFPAWPFLGPAASFAAGSSAHRLVERNGARQRRAARLPLPPRAADVVPIPVKAHIVEQFPGSEISGVGNSRELPGTPTPGGNSRESGRSGGSRVRAASPNPDKHFQWDWRVLGYLRTVRHAPGASAWPDPAHSTKRVCRVHCNWRVLPVFPGLAPRE